MAEQLIDFTNLIKINSIFPEPIKIRSVQKKQMIIKLHLSCLIVHLTTSLAGLFSPLP